MTPERWRLAQEVFHGATERESGSRAIFLEETCRGDPELRKEVESLLSSFNASPASFLESPAIAGVPALPPPATSPRPLGKGTQLGPYEILSSLGSGGMGEVYRARDPRLGREVAVKVLPAEWSSDATRVRRFEQEARSASALNHPNIVTVYDTGISEGVAWIAMERVDGSTLRDLVGGPIAVKSMLAIATQIADGLAKAHEAGIVHRDLKPENVMVTKDGLVKILDFGLAKLTSTGSGSGEASKLPTMTGTTPGVIVGTVGYMSPEQASGERIDFRSDQFSFGSILYEMATGKRAFQRKTAIDTLGAILNDEPDPIASINPRTPTQLRWIVERCLAKDPRQRYSSTDDLARDLAKLGDHLSEATSGGAVATPQRRRLALPLFAAMALAAVLLAGGIFGGRWAASRELRTQALSIHQLTYRRGNVLHARFAPGGRTVVYGAAWDGAPSEVFTVRTDSNESRPVGLSPADVLGVSPRGELAVLLKKMDVAWGGRGTLARLPLEGGTPREVLEDVSLADWAPNGEDLAVNRRLPGGGTRLEYPIGTVVTDAARIGYFRVSPDGGRLAFLAGGQKWATVNTMDRKGKRTVLSDGWLGTDGLVWSPTGDEIIFSGAHTVDDWAIRAVSLSGRERVLVPGAFIIHDVAPDGRLLVERTVSRGGIRCETQGANGERELGRLDGSTVTDISADGKAVLFAERGAHGFDQRGIYLRRTDGTPAVRLGEGESMGLSPDGHWVLNVLAGPPHELVMTPTGPGPAKKIPVEGVEPLRASLLPNAKGFLVVGKDKSDSVAVFLLGPEGGKPTPVRAEGFGPNWGITLSPEGDRFVYDAGEGQIKISPISGGEASAVNVARLERKEEIIQWSADGRFLYLWHAGDVPARVDRMELTTGKREPWKRLAPQDPVGIVAIGPVVVAPDGQSLAYSYMRILTSDLFVIEGLR